MALIGLTLKSHPATARGGRKLKGQSKVLPCVFTGSDVSATPQRLWPGAQWTIAVPGPREYICVQQAANKAISPMKTSLDPRRDQGPLQTSRGLWGRTPGKRVPVTAEAFGELATRERTNAYRRTLCSWRKTVNAASSVGRCNDATFKSRCIDKPIPKRNKLCQHLVREGTRDFEERMTSSVTQI